jgi:hypothetical protein
MSTTKVVPISGTNTIQKTLSIKSKHTPGTTARQAPLSKPSWLVEDLAKDGSPRYFVRLPFSEHQIGEPKYYGPFLTEASAYFFEKRAYDLIFEAATEVYNAANEIHEEELDEDW